MRNKSRLLLALVIALPLLLLGLRAVNDPADLGEAAGETERFDITNTEIDRETLRIASRLDSTFDNLVNTQEKLRAFTQETEGCYICRQSKFKDLVEYKLANIEKFKSSYATLSNSMTFLEETAAQLDDMHLDPASALPGMLARIQVVASHPELVSGEEIETNLTLLHNDRHTPKDLIRAVERHARFVVREYPSLHRVIESIVNSPLRETINKDALVLHNAQEKAYSKNRFLKVALSVFAFILLGVLIFVLMYQDRHISAQTSHVNEQNAVLQSSLAELHQAQAQLVQGSKLSALGEMAGGVAHEINNPITIVLLMSEEIENLLERDPTNIKALTKAATRIKNTANRIANIVAGLRSISRDGRTDQLEEFTAASLVEDTLGFCSERFRGHGVRVDVAIEPADARVTGRRVEISQVLLNLMNNAFDAVVGCKNPWVSVRIDQGEKDCVISVTDSGSGVPAEVAAKIFSPFFTTKGAGKGTGLGLSISAGILQAHKGKLTLDTECSNTCFKATLPRQAA